jgi:hypothetical protein
MAESIPQVDRRFDRSALTLPCWLAVGLAACGLAVSATGGGTEPGWPAVAAISLSIAGLILIGTAIARTPQNALVIAFGALTAILARLATHPSWDSAQLLFQVMAGVAVFAFVIVLLPRPLRQVAASVLIVFHFCGILSAITSPQPQSWLSHWSWVTLFRPHLVFCYTNNAYQFYSPDPGPASLLWFCVEYQDGEKTWYKSPRKPETHLDPLSVEFFRRLSMVDAINQNVSLPFVPTDIIQDRQQLISQYPIHPDYPLAQQYFVPQPMARRTLASYVRHIIFIHGGPEKVRSVKVYRVLHRMLDARQFAAGTNPFGETTYLPYYQGEYDGTGTQLNPNNDPLLFWLIPIIRKPAVVTPTTRPGMEAVDNYLTTHAGINPFDDRYGAAP